MAKNETRRLKPSILADDLEIYAALKAIGSYAPANPAYSKEAIDALHTALLAKRDSAAQADAAAAAARDDYVAAQWDMHNGILGVKDQAVAQYGLDSNEVQSLKLKKKSEYKSPTRKAPPKT